MGDYWSTNVVKWSSFMNVVILNHWRWVGHCAFFLNHKLKSNRWSHCSTLPFRRKKTKTAATITNLQPLFNVYFQWINLFFLKLRRSHQQVIFSPLWRDHSTSNSLWGAAKYSQSVSYFKRKKKKLWGQWRRRRTVRHRERSWWRLIWLLGSDDSIAKQDAFVKLYNMVRHKY